MDDGKVSIVILNWNCKRYLKNCIESVQRQTYKNIEVYLIDNASSDGSVEYIKKEFLDLKIIRNSENIGFAKAHNLGIRKTNGLYYMPLNPDVVLTDNFVEEIVTAINSEENIGWASGKVFFMNQDGAKTDIIYSTGHTIDKNYYFNNRGYGQRDTVGYTQKDYIFGANGACPLYKREMIEDIKYNTNEYFDEMFFMYGTDVDIDWRAQLLGWKCVYSSKAVAFHIGEGSGGLKDYSIRLEYIRRRHIMILKNEFILDIFLHCLPLMIKEFIAAAIRKDKLTCKALIGTIRYLPEILIKRFQIMKKRKVPRGYISNWVLR